MTSWFTTASGTAHFWSPFGCVCGRSCLKVSAATEGARRCVTCLASEKRAVSAERSIGRR